MRKVEDNSLSGLSFAFLDGVQEASPGESDTAVEVEASATPEEVAGPGETEEAPTIVAASTAEPMVVSGHRRRAWGLFYGIRSVIVALVVLCVGSLVFTMVLNPELTFEETVGFLYQQVVQAAKRIGAMLQ